MMIIGDFTGLWTMYFSFLYSKKREGCEGYIGFTLIYLGFSVLIHYSHDFHIFASQ